MKDRYSGEHSSELGNREGEISLADMAETSFVSKLREFMENEARSGSMDFGCVTPQYVYRMFGGSVSIDEITNALNYLKANNYGY